MNIIRLHGRQKGLDKQMEVIGDRAIEVYDFRQIFEYTPHIKKSELEKGLLIASISSDSDRERFFGSRNVNSIITSKFNPGKFVYSNYGGSDSDEQYVSVRLNSAWQLGDMKTMLEDMGGVDLMWGAEIPYFSLEKIINEDRNKISDTKVKSFLGSSKKSQVEQLRELLEKEFKD